MLLILGLTANLSLTLQQKDQDILNAMSLVESTKRELQKLRDDGWDSLMAKVASSVRNIVLRCLSWKKILLILGIQGREPT